MNKKYLLVESSIKKQYVEESVTIAAGLIALRFIMILIYFYKYTNDMMNSAKIDEDMTKKFNDIIPDKFFKWKLRIIENSNEINAWTVGGENLYITRGLLSLLNHDEVMAVMLHEAGHTKSFHVWQRLALEEGGFLLIMGLIGKLLIPIIKLFKTDPKLAILSYVGIIMLSPMLELAKKYWSRVNEFQADNWAVKYGYGDHLISAFKKMMNEYKKEKPCNNITCKLFRKYNDLMSTHPKMQKRIERILETQEAKKALIDNAKNPTKALLKIASLLGATKESAEKIDDNSVTGKIKNLIKKDIETTLT